jgi:hypothetical protein
MQALACLLDDRLSQVEQQHAANQLGWLLQGMAAIQCQLDDSGVLHPGLVLVCSLVPRFADPTLHHCNAWQ